MVSTKKLYYGFVILLTIVLSLTAVSFSYFVPDSNTAADVEVGKRMVVMSSDELVDGEAIIEANSTKEIKVTVLNGSDFDNSFRIYYEKELDNVEIYTNDLLKDNINSNSMYNYKIIVENYNDEAVTVKFDVVSGFKDDYLKVPGVALRMAN